MSDYTQEVLGNWYKFFLVTPEDVYAKKWIVLSRYLTIFFNQYAYHRGILPDAVFKKHRFPDGVLHHMLGTDLINTIVRHESRMDVFHGIKHLGLMVRTGLVEVARFQLYVEKDNEKFVVEELSCKFQVREHNKTFDGNQYSVDFSDPSFDCFCEKVSEMGAVIASFVASLDPVVEKVRLNIKSEFFKPQLESAFTPFIHDTQQITYAEEMSGIELMETRVLAQTEVETGGKKMVQDNEPLASAVHLRTKFFNGGSDKIEEEKERLISEVEQQKEFHRYQKTGKRKGSLFEDPPESNQTLEGADDVSDPASEKTIESHRDDNQTANISLEEVQEVVSDASQQHDSDFENPEKTKSSSRPKRGRKPKATPNTKKNPPKEGKVAKRRGRAKKNKSSSPEPVVTSIIIAGDEKSSIDPQTILDSPQINLVQSVPITQDSLLTSQPAKLRNSTLQEDLLKSLSEEANSTPPPIQSLPIRRRLRR